jgi:diguanylate cyclase
MPLPHAADWPHLLASAFVAAAAFALWLQVQARLRATDRVVAVGWWLVGSLTVGAGLLASRLLLPGAGLPELNADAGRLGPGLALAAPVIGVAVALVLARGSAVSPPGRWVTLAQMSALVAGMGVATLAVSGQGAAWSDGTSDWGPPAIVLGAPWLGALLAWGVLARVAPPAPPDEPRRPTGIGLLPATPPQRVVARVLGAAAVFGLCWLGSDLVRLAQAWDEAPRERPADEGLLLAALLVPLAMGWIAAAVDFRTWRHTRDLATSLGEANTRLRDLALRDALTRLPNRLHFEERLTEAVDRAEASGATLAVMFLDLDGFKPINDSFGHVIGDDVLREVGRRLSGLARSTDVVARVGGDEFLMLVENAGGETQMVALAQRVLRLLGEPYALPNGLQSELSCSIGMALFPQHGPQSRLIANADAAMYAAKASGGAAFAFYEPRMELDARAQLELQHDLRLALDRGELQLFYQPKIDGLTAQITGVEALVRWHHPSRGLISPAQFIPVAERFGLIGPLGAWVIEEACRQLRAWQDEGLRMRVSVNLSMHQLRQEDLVTRIRMVLERHAVDPALLTFEITETVAMEDTQATMRSFGHLARLGSILSIDDFGTGYSSLAYLRKLPARQLKIDRSFVADIAQGGDALAVVDAVIQLAHALGLRVVAEGVETQAQRDLLLRLRCDEMQGYLFAKPMPAHMLALWARGDPDEATTVPAELRARGG